MNSKEIEKITNLEFTRNAGQYFKVGNSKINFNGYLIDEGICVFHILNNNQSNKVSLFIGGSFKLEEKNSSVTLLSYSYKTGRVELRIAAPRRIKIDRG